MKELKGRQFWAVAHKSSVCYFAATEATAPLNTYTATHTSPPSPTPPTPRHTVLDKDIRFNYIDGRKKRKKL